MGARVSISFKNGKEKSVVLFNHWGGKSFPKLANEFIEYQKSVAKTSVKKHPNVSDPTTRMEPNTLMVQFIAWLQEKGEINDSIYLGKTENDGDNSDEGHFTIIVKDLSKIHL